MVANDQDDRLCEGCLQTVTNENLGGHDGKPLSGPVYCLNCADDVRALSRHLGRVLRVQLDNILMGIRALRVATWDLSLQPNASNAANLKFIARGLKTACNRLRLEIRRNGVGSNREGRSIESHLWIATVRGQMPPPASSQWLHLRPELRCIDDDAQALCLALLELMLNPVWESRSERLRVLAAELSEKCNRLSYRLVGRATR